MDFPSLIVSNEKTRYINNPIMQEFYIKTTI